MRPSLLRVIVTCGALVVTAPAFAAVDAYMTFGTGKGETKVHVTSVSQTAAPRDMATGMASGKRMHKPITITKEIDQASPMLTRLMQSHGSLPEVTIAFTGGGAGKANTAEKIVLKNAMVTSVQQKGATETLTLDYEQIEVTYTNGGKTAMDDWESPK